MKFWTRVTAGIVLGLIQAGCYCCDGSYGHGHCGGSYNGCVSEGPCYGNCGATSPTCSNACVSDRDMRKLEKLQEKIAKKAAKRCPHCGGYQGGYFSGAVGDCGCGQSAATCGAPTCGFPVTNYATCGAPVSGCASCGAPASNCASCGFPSPNCASCGFPSPNCASCALPMSEMSGTMNGSYYGGCPTCEQSGGEGFPMQVPPSSMEDFYVPKPMEKSQVPPPPNAPDPSNANLTAPNAVQPVLWVPANLQ